MSMSASEHEHAVRSALASALGKKPNRPGVDDVDLTVVFAGTPHPNALSRVWRFQKVLYFSLGFFPKAVDAQASCLRVQFALPDFEKESIQECKDFFSSDDFKEIAQDLGVKTIVYGTLVKHFPLLSAEEYLSRAAS